MGYTVDLQTVKLAARCEKNHSCQGEDGISLCPAGGYEKHHTLFIECRSREVCIYRKKLGGRNACECPVRKEIFNLYGK